MTGGLRAALAAGAVAAWSALADFGFVQHRALAGPIATLRALAIGMSDGALAADVLATGWRVAAGVAIGAVVGAPLGLFVGASDRRRRHLEPSLDFLRAIPPLLVFPLLLLALGYGDSARVAAIAWASLLVVSLHVAAGRARTGAARARAIAAMGASRWQRLVWLEIPEALPHATTALRHAVATGMVVGVVTEMVVGAPDGLGARAVSAQIAYDAPQLYAVIATTGLLGFTAGRALHGIERRLLADRAAWD